MGTLSIFDRVVLAWLEMPIFFFQLKNLTWERRSFPDLKKVKQKMIISKR